MATEMSLNLLLTSRHAAYLTGDFRLTFGPDRFQDNLLAQKIVPVLKFGWCGLISFCGVAITSTNIDVGDWISQQVHPQQLKERIEDFIGRLRSADAWLRPLRGNTRITISVVGFQGRRPFLLSLSNYQYLDGQPFPKVLSHLKMFEIKPKTPEIRVLGDVAAVSADEKSSLRQHLMRPDSDGPMVMDALAKANWLAATRSAVISAECVVGRVIPTGLGWLRPYGVDRDSEYMPNYIRRDLEANGIDAFELKKNDRGDTLKPGWVQTAFNFDKLESGKKVTVTLHE